MENGNLYRGRNKTKIVGLLVQLHRALLVAAESDGDDRAQRDALKNPTAIRSQEESATGVVLVGDDVDLRPCAESEIAEQVTR